MSQYVKRTKKLKTTDQWYGNYGGNKVIASTMKLTDGLYRVCIWGNDDFGMERDFVKRVDARECYENLPSVITMKYLESIGFKAA